MTAGARAVVDQAVTVAGGASYRSASELARLQRDVLAGRFHPSSTDSAGAPISVAANSAARALSAMCLPGTDIRITRWCFSPAS